MNPLLEALAVTAPIVIISLVAIYVSLIAWESPDEGPVLLGEVLARQGEGALRLATASGAYDFACAVRSCAACQAAPQCRAWLESGAREGYQGFCPNAGYVGRIAALAAKR